MNPDQRQYLVADLQEYKDAIEAADEEKNTFLFVFNNWKRPKHGMLA